MRVRVQAIGRGELALICILALALALRLYGLDAESLWNDELATVFQVDHPPWHRRTWARISNDVHPPGYVFLLWGFCTIFGDSEFALRLPSALAGALGVFIVYRLGRRLFSRAAGCAGALLAAVSPFLIEYSQEARAYSLLFLTSGWLMLACHDLLCAPRGTPLLRGGVVKAAVAAVCGAYLHYSGLLFAVTVLSASCVYALVSVRFRVAAVLAASGLALLLYLPWVPWLLDDLAKGGLAFLEPPGIADLTGLANVAVPPYVYLVCAALATLAYDAAGRAETARPNLPVNATLYLSGVFVVFVLGVYFKSIWSDSIFNTRNLMVVWPSVFVLLGAAATRVHRHPGKLVAAGVLCVLAMVVVLEFVYEAEYYSKNTKQHYRQATRAGVSWVEGKHKVRVVTLAYGRRFNYYLKRFSGNLKVNASASASAKAAKLVEKQFARGSKHVLLLSGHINPTSLLRDMKRRYRVEHTQKFPGATATLLQKRSNSRKGND